ncbi:MAG: non-ribosomal peptide synthetase, partial [Gammaproteobacteria bacterium]|nr:non-ribosomal peptide synthetase [Gammaproteobacteria bacterium]
EIDRTLAPDLIQQAVLALYHHHDALRLRFSHTAAGWQQYLPSLPGNDTQDIYQVIDLAHLPSASQQPTLVMINRELQASLQLVEGPLLRVAWLDFGSKQPARLLIIIHHLAIDWVSWRILISDLWTGYEQLAQHQPVQLPAKTSSFKQWTTWLTEYAHSQTLLAELDHWLTLTTQSISPLPVDFAGQDHRNTVASADLVMCSLSVAETRRLLQDVPPVYHTQINDFLLTALAQAFALWTGHPTLYLDLEGHGREELTETLDLSRTVGWFTSMFPVCLHLDSPDAGQAITSIKEQLRHIPRRGVGYGLLRYLNPETAAQLAALSQAEIVFNYGGQFKVESMTDLGDEVAQANHLGYLLHINGAVINDQLSLSWVYSQNLYRRDTIERLAQSFISALQAL